MAILAAWSRLRVGFVLGTSSAWATRRHSELQRFPATR
jgi:hypothetical protein